MCKLKFIPQLLWVVALLTVMSSTQAAADAQQRITEADNYRLAAQSAKVITEVKLFKGDKLDKQRLYHVFIRPNRQSLVLFQSASEKGQKVLMLDDKFWLLMPRSKRPIRITPMQKLIGDASVGDISNLKWSEDYQATVVDETQQIEDKPVVQLKLEGDRNGLTYYTIELWLERDTNIPIKANYYLKSGKLAKVAQFMFNPDSGHIGQMTLQDHIQKNRRTEVTYLSNSAATLPDRFYNPAYLARNPRLNVE
jgi:hypothetical protein